MTKYSCRFSGHQTFPLRYGWLYKFFQKDPSGKFENASFEDLMVEWGVGRNMVEAIKYWGRQVGLKPENEMIAFGYDKIHENDPYLEKMDSLWLLHWFLCSNYSEMTAYRIFFNFYNGLKLSRESYLDYIKELFNQRHFIANTKRTSALSLPADASLKKDIGVFLQCYVAGTASGKVTEDSFASPLCELGLLKRLDKQTYLCELERRTTLGDKVFLFALIDFFATQNTNEQQSLTMAFDTFFTAPGSPSRVFRMSRSEVEQRLDAVSKLTASAIDWTDTQGLRQIQVSDASILSEQKRSSYLMKVYK